MIRTRHIEKRAVANSRIGADAPKRNYVYEDFGSNPVSAKVGGGAAGGTAGDTNVLVFPHTGFEYHIKGTQTITAPSKVATGLDIGMDQTDDDGVELSCGILAGGEAAFVVGTSGAFSVEVLMSIADVSGTDDCAVGIRKAEAYQANIDDYADMACLNVISGDIKIETIVGGAATVTTDTTQNWADGASHTLTVHVSAGGVVTYEIDGAAPTVTAAYTFTSALTVVPFIFLLNASDVAGAVVVQSFECGLDSEA